MILIDNQMSLNVLILLSHLMDPKTHLEVINYYKIS